MRAIPTMAKAASACLFVGVTVTGCTDDGSAMKGSSAEQMLDDANAVMRGLTSVTIKTVTKKNGGDVTSTRLSTDLKATCAFTMTSSTGAGLEQIRTDGTDYVRPNRAYLEESGYDVAGTGQQDLWAKTPADTAQPGDGLAGCTQEFASFGEVSEGGPAEVDGAPAMVLKVADGTDKGGSFAFYVATEGKPYLLKVVYEGEEVSTTTSFSAFDEPLDVHVPDADEVVDPAAVDWDEGLG
ncbi:hypothetical protein [Streptomyces sp. NPDC019224]|uniref:hypothetical protein n=1 Tax=Streptomyces sp. NPDC019224 TaxID=3154484 RepID=UPI0033D886BB